MYLHATRDRDRAIAQVLGELVREVRPEPTDRRGSRPNRAGVGHETGRVWQGCGTNRSGWLRSCDPYPGGGL
jgi:hypothetical protein